MSRYDFGSIVCEAGGREYTHEEYRAAARTILGCAFDYARRHDLRLRYIVRDLDTVHVWLWPLRLPFSPRPFAAVDWTPGEPEPRFRITLPTQETA